MSGAEVLRGRPGLVGERVDALVQDALADLHIHGDILAVLQPIADIARLVQRAAEGDRWAWERLVDQYARLIWAMTRDFKLVESDAADVAQATWLRLLEHIDRLEYPARVGSWLAATARNECLRSVAARKRVVLVQDDVTLKDDGAHAPAVDEPVAEGGGANVLDSPLLALAHLVHVTGHLHLRPDRRHLAVTIDEEGTVKTFNPAGEKIFGYAASEVIERNIKLLEDCALSLFSGDTGRYGDAAIFSFRKSLPSISCTLFISSFLPGNFRRVALIV
jgi:RNA polymerase sigma factor (sigma-70 family)